jgi:TRAP-type mannitol/chloroaromatic compound transport system substrate-binding protein
MEPIMKNKHFWPILALTMIMVFLVSASPALAASKVIKWKMVTCWTPNYKLIEQDKYFLKLVDELVGDQFKIEFFPAGTLMKSKQTFDAVKAGTVQMGSDFPGYWAGKDTAFNFLASYPLGMTASDYIGWIYQGGGWKEYQRVYGKFGMIYFPHGPITVESGPRGTKPIASLKDYQGLKLRMSGKVQGKVLHDIGTSQVKISSSEVYQAMQKGVIDAAESCTPEFDWGLGYGEITTFSSHPGWHQPGSMCGIMINKKAWNKLPKNIQAAIKIAAQATVTQTLAYQEFTSMEGTKKFNDKGVKPKRLSEADLIQLAKLVNKYTYEECAANPSFAKTAYSYFSYLHGYQPWRKLAAPLGQGWENQPLPDLEKIKSYIK